MNQRIEQVQEIAQHNNAAASSNQQSVQSYGQALEQITGAIQAVSEVVHQLGQDSEK